MRGCLAPAVLEMAFLQSECQEKALWPLGAGCHPVTCPAAACGGHCSSAHTGLCLGPLVLSSRQLSSCCERGSSCVSLQSLLNWGTVPLSWPCTTRCTAIPHSSAATSLLRGALQSLYSYCCFTFCWIIFALFCFVLFFSFSPALSQPHQPPNCSHLAPFHGRHVYASASFQTPGKAFYWRREKMGHKAQPSPDGHNLAGLLVSTF